METDCIKQEQEALWHDFIAAIDRALNKMSRPVEADEFSHLNCPKCGWSGQPEVQHNRSFTMTIQVEECLSVMCGRCGWSELRTPLDKR